MGSGGAGAALVPPGVWLAGPCGLRSRTQTVRVSLGEHTQLSCLKEAKTPFGILEEFAHERLL